MSSSTFVTRLKRGAFHSAMAGFCVVPREYAEANATAGMEGEQPIASEVQLTMANIQERAAANLSITLTEEPKEWTQETEREFRHLALLEARRTVSEEQLSRLERLSLLRDRLDSPRSVEDILRQLKHDRVLQKMAEALKDYVEFRQDANKKRPASS